MKQVSDFITYISYIIIALFAIIGVISVCSKLHYKTPVEGNNDIGYLTEANDSIKLKVESLDSIKNAKVIEVVSLDNDSSIKLFYKLVSE